MNPAEIFARLEAQYPDLPKGYLDAIWAAESGRGKFLKNPTSSARGHFQFIDSTAKRYGLTDADRNDLAKSAAAAARMAATDAKTLAKLGVPVTIGSLYTLHQQGAGGGRALLQTPDAPAVDVLTRVYGGNRKRAEAAITGNKGRLDMSAGDFANHIASFVYAKAGIKPESAPRTVPQPERRTQPQTPTGFMGFLTAPAEPFATFLQDLNVGPRQRRSAPSSAPRLPELPDAPTPASDFLRKVLRDVGVEW